MLKRFLVACACAALFLASGCGTMKKLSKQEMLDRVAGKTRKGELRTILGEPEKSANVGGRADEAYWMYNASDGELKFHIFGDFFEPPVPEKAPAAAVKKTPDAAAKKTPDTAAKKTPDPAAKTAPDGAAKK